MGKKRLYYLDNLKILMCMLIITVHVSLAYTPNIWWFFKSSLESKTLLMYYQVFSTIAVGQFFLIAAYFIPASYDKRGGRVFLKQRCKMYLIPIILGLVCIILPLHYFYHINFRSNGYNNFFDYTKNIFLGIGGKPQNWHDNWLTVWPDIKFAHLWFLEHLLVYSIIYVFIKKIRRKFNCKDNKNILIPKVSEIVLFTMVLSIVTFVIRIWSPLDFWGGFLGFIQVEYANLPKYIVFIFIGILSYRHNWLSAISKSQGMKWLFIGLFLLVAAFIGKGRLDFITARGGVNIQSFIWSVWDCYMCMSLSIGCIVFFRESFNATSSFLKVLSENIFGVYIFHVPIIALLQFGLSNLKLPILIKFLIEVILGITVSFVVTYILRYIYFILENKLKLGVIIMKKLINNKTNDASGSKKMKFSIINKKVLAVLIIAAVLGAGTKVSISLLGNQGLSQEKYTVIKSGSNIKKINAKGEVKSENSVNVYSDTNLIIKDVKVDVGDEVKANDVLAVLDTNKLEDKIRELEATLVTSKSANKVALDEAKSVYDEVLNKTTAETNTQIKDAEVAVNQAKLDCDNKQELYEKYTVLYGNDAASEQQLKEYKLSYENAKEVLDKCTVTLENINNTIQRNIDQAKNSYDEAMVKYEDKSQEIAIENMKKDLKNAVITAPVDGVITAKNASEGNASSGVLFEIKDKDDITVNVNVKEVDIEKINLGQKAEIKADSLGADIIEGEVISIQPIANAEDKGALDLSSNSEDKEAEFEVKIKMDDSERMKIGMKAQADIIIDEEENKESYLVPVESIIKDKDDNECVYIAEKLDKDYVIKQVEITKGSEDDINVEIFSGDLSDDTIVLNNPSDYEVGSTIKIK